MQVGERVCPIDAAAVTGGVRLDVDDRRERLALVGDVVVVAVAAGALGDVAIVEQAVAVAVEAGIETEVERVDPARLADRAVAEETAGEDDLTECDRRAEIILDLAVGRGQPVLLGPAAAFVDEDVRRPGEGGRGR